MSVQANAIVVVGSGLSGYTLIRQLRAYDPGRPVTLVTADGGEVYSKPLLSNALAQHQTPDSMIQKSAQAKAAELGVQLVTHCRVLDIDADARVLHTTRGDIGYGDLVLATGGRQRVIVPDAADARWIDTVNNLDDYRRWYAKLESGVQRVLLIGAGLIGCEFADDLMHRGIGVTMVDPAPWPLSRLVPEALGATLANALSENGADVRTGRHVKRLEREGDGFRATLDDGSPVAADLVMSAVGLVPETELARSAGVQVAQGVLVDERLATSDPHIYAMGDCAQTGAGVLPYILPLMAQAKVLAQVLAGQDVRLTMKAMPVVVKTSSLPLVVCPPRVDAAGQWQVEGSGRHLKAVFRGTAGDPLGFALAGNASAERGELSRTMPPLLA
ncbi:NAD(P)/FAD-dependent oxidoreductase [Salinisphaera aquimarina]|uniref:NAD(P)/FAD-dependent oxidoreductase n=1 Tax=Salinisphaera aquimarina TaxID=2094031 RepID=A0ABV7EUA6_9GAMM